jgi:hypothetical protein
MSGYPPEVALDHALASLVKAKTALEGDPTDLPIGDYRWWRDGEANEYVVAMIDDAVRLLTRVALYVLSPEKEEPKFGLMVCRDGVSMTRPFDPEEEAIDAVGAALIAKGELPDSVITIVVGRVGP